MLPLGSPLDVFSPPPVLKNTDGSECISEPKSDERRTESLAEVPLIGDANTFCMDCDGRERNSAVSCRNNSTVRSCMTLPETS